MAYIKNIPIKKTVQACIKYITDPKKTNNCEYVSDSGINFRLAGGEWERIRKSFNKDDGIKAHHFIQSFDPKHGITPEEANRIGQELAQKQFGRLGFDFIVATHVDTGVIHNHILVNNVSHTTGKKYNHDKRSYKFLRQLNIDVCRANGIPAVDSYMTDINYSEETKGVYKQEEVDLGKMFKSKPYVKTHAHDSWTEKQLTNVKRIRTDINDVIKKVASWEEFVEQMQQRGYKVDWKTKGGKDKKYVTYTPKGAERGKRDRSLGLEYFSKEAIIRRIIMEQERKKKEEEYEKRRNQSLVIVKKTYVPKQQYYIDPNWDITPLYFGRTHYRRRSFLESLLIRTFYKKRRVINEHEFKGNKVNKSLYESSKREMDDLRKIIELMNKNGFKTEQDIDYRIEEDKLEKFLLQENLNEVKEELKNCENIAEILKIVEAEKGYWNEYQSLDTEKQRNYFYANKIHIQKYAVATRKLELYKSEFVNVEQAKEKIKYLYIELERFNQKTSVIEDNLNKYHSIKQFVKTQKKEEKHSKKDKEK